MGLGNQEYVALCLVNGLWQLCALSAALSEHHAGSRDRATRFILVVYNVGKNHRNLESVLAAARGQGLWEAVFDGSDILQGPSPEEWPLSYRRDGARLRALIGVERVDEVWLGHIFSYAERLVLEAFPKAFVAIYEEGLTPYGPFEQRKVIDFPWRAFLRSFPRLVLSLKLRSHLVSLRMSDWRVSPRYLRRVRSVYLLDSALSENLRCMYPGEHLLVNRNILIRTIETIAARFDISSSLAGMPRKPERVVLLLNPFTQRCTEYGIYGNS